MKSIYSTFLFITAVIVMRARVFVFGRFFFASLIFASIARASNLASKYYTSIKNLSLTYFSAALVMNSKSFNEVDTWSMYSTFLFITDVIAMRV